MTIQKITEKATCFFCILLPRYNTIFPHLGNMVETLHWHSHSKTTWTRTKKTCKKNWYEYDTATLGCLAEYGSHGLWSKCLLPTSKTDFKTIPLDIKTCLLHLASVAINKKNMEGRQRTKTNAGMSAMAMLHSVSNCVCYRVGKLPLLGWEVSQRLFLKSWMIM